MSAAFRMQFALGPRIPPRLEDWQQFRLDEAFHLTAHPDLNIVQASKGSISTTLIGYLLDPQNPHSDNTDILESLITEFYRGRDLFEIVHPLGGRWVLIVNNGQQTKLFGDATGLRQVFYSHSSISSEIWCASQPGHIANVLGLKMDPLAIEFIEWFQEESSESWWPGNSSPYSEISRLLPNHYLDLKTWDVQRFWPQESLETRPLRASVDRVATTLTDMINSAANRFSLAMAMSAGWDSRLMLAASRPVAKNLTYYTSKRTDMNWTHMDVRVPKRLLAKLKLPHEIIQAATEITPEFAQSFTNNVPFAHPERMAGLQAQLKCFGRQKVGMTGNVSEVARCHYWREGENGQDITPEILMKVTGMDHPFARTYFKAWLEDVDDPKGYNILDLFYWEQRAASWFAHNCLEFDSTWQDIFIPFNSRKLLTDMLAIDEEHRKAPNYELYQRLIMCLWPEVLSEPINPISKRRWTLKVLRAVVRRLR